MRRYLPILLALHAACVRVESFDPANIALVDFNPRLRPDLRPLTPAQLVASVPQQLFTAGGAAADNVLTWMFPTFPGTSRDAGLANLGNPSCFWMAQNDRAVLAWEAYARLVADADEPRFTKDHDLAAACTGTNPFDRSPLTLEDGSVGLPSVDTVSLLAHWAGVVVTRHTYAPSRELDRYDVCNGILPTVATVATDVEPPCEPDPETGGNPLCNPGGCAFSVTEDMSFTAVASFLGKSSPARAFGPSLKVVGASRTLSRPLRLASGSTWTWRVAELPDHRMEENFSPNVTLSAMRVFRRYPDGKTAYVMPTEVNIDGALACRVMSQPADFDIYKACPFIANAPKTPTYDVTDLNRRRTEWGVVLPGAVAGATYYLEMTVRDATRNTSAITVSPTVLDLGRVQRNTSVHDTLFVENTGTMTVDVTSASVTVDSRLASVTVTPQTGHLAPRDVLALDVALVGLQSGAATITVKTRTGLTAAATVRFEVIDGPRADAFPARLGFRRHAAVGAEPLSFYQKHVVLANDGHLPMTFSGARLAGSRPELWKFVVNGVPQATYTTSPVTIAPGGYIELLMLFDPPAATVAGSYDADLLFDTDGTNVPSGVATIRMTGAWFP